MGNNADVAISVALNLEEDSCIFYPLCHLPDGHFNVVAEMTVDHNLYLPASVVR